MLIKIPKLPEIGSNLAEKIRGIVQIRGLDQIFGGIRKQVDRLNPKPAEKPKEPPYYAD